MTAASDLVLQLAPQVHYDTTLLEQLLDTINRRFFNNHICATVRWEIPSGRVAVFTGINRADISGNQPILAAFVRAVEFIEQNDLQAALPLLFECTDAGHEDAHLLLNHLLKRMGDERWVDYVKRYNRYQDSQKAVPAACYYPESHAIAIHPYIFERKAPQLVLKYLIYHECCHQLIESDCSTPHPPEFMDWEYRAPGRVRALEWLNKEGYPTLPLRRNDI